MYYFSMRIPINLSGGPKDSFRESFGQATPDLDEFLFISYLTTLTPMFASLDLPAGRQVGISSFLFSI
jgi:hypothetical protein